MTEPEYPQVKSLTYRCVLGDYLDFSTDEGEVFETGSFRGQFAEGGQYLRCELFEHFSTIADAREAVQRTLRSWELDVALRHRLLPEQGLQFEFEGADVLQRNPSTGKVTTKYQAGFEPGEISIEGSVAVMKVERRNPVPPRDFIATMTVELLMQRYAGYRQGKEQLPSFGQFVFTAVKVEYGSEDEAAEALSLSGNVLRRLRRLSSRKGDVMSARKFADNREFRPLTSGEVRWLRDVTALLIRRLGEHAAGKDLDYLTNEDLPDISAE